ncbi:MAG: GntR family transcriptional regulator [Thermoanaerobaculia bacterium]
MALALKLRQNLSVDLADLVRNLIVEGTFRSGERINEVDLASRLDVSRTPVREALSRLASEGFVTIQPRRGFFVQDLRPEQVEHLYMIRATLDPAALELAGIPSNSQLVRLASINKQLSTSGGDPSLTIDLDDRWHLELLSHCHNQILLDLIHQFILRTRPYECAYMREHANVAVVVAKHARVLEALRTKDLQGAAAALRRNLQTAVPQLIQWLRKTSESRDEPRV